MSEIIKNKKYGNKVSSYVAQGYAVSVVNSATQKYNESNQKASYDVYGLLKLTKGTETKFIDVSYRVRTDKSKGDNSYIDYIANSDRTTVYVNYSNELSGDAYEFAKGLDPEGDFIRIIEGNCSYKGPEENPYLYLFKINNINSKDNIIINKNTKYIIEGTFKYVCATNVTFEEGSQLTKIVDHTFENCNLISITIPNSVTRIGEAAFWGCDSLINVTFEEGSKLKSIGENAFNYCHSLTSITIPNSVTSIGESVFKYSNLMNVTFEEGSKLTTIGWSAFEKCNLTSITIPNSVTSILAYAFNDCGNLKTVYYIGNITDWNNISILNGNDDLLSATIYYYSETEPTEEGNYWHYDTDGATPVFW